MDRAVPFALVFQAVATLVGWGYFQRTLQKTFGRKSLLPAIPAILAASAIATVSFVIRGPPFSIQAITAVWIVAAVELAAIGVCAWQASRVGGANRPGSD